MPSSDYPRNKFPKIAGDRYEYLAHLGKGSAGHVFKAKDNVLGSTVVIKSLHADLNSAEDLQRFQREARAFSALSHPNILKVLDFGLTTDETPYLVMQFVKGTTVEQHIEQNGVFTAEEALGLMSQVCEAMSHAHKKGVLHRDLKPSNLLLEEAQSGKLHVFIFDFGLAKLSLSEDSDTLTKPGQIIGTAEYMSPEQARGERCTPASDIYSAGCILFELVTGKPPFVAKSLMEVVQHQKDSLPPLHLLSDLGFDVMSVVEKAMEKKPRRRYAAMDEMRVAIDKVLDEGYNPIVPDDQTTAASSISTTGWYMKSQKKRRIRPLTLGVIIAVLGAILVSFIFLQFDRGEMPEELARSLEPEGHELVKTTTVLQNIRPETIDMARTQNTDSKVLRMFSRKVPCGVLDASFSDLSDTSLDIMDQWKPTGLILSGTSISNSGLQSLRGVRTLRVLKIDNCRNTTSDGLASLSHMSGLRSLRLGGSQLADADLRFVLPGRFLYVLELTSSPQLTDRCLDFIGQLERLRKLRIGACPNIPLDKLDAWKRERRIMVSVSNLPLDSTGRPAPMIKRNIEIPD